MIRSTTSPEVDRSLSTAAPQTLLDLSAASRVFAHGNDTQRTGGALRILTGEAGPLGGVTEAVQAVVFGGASRVLGFSAEEQRTLKELPGQFAHASAAERERLLDQHAPLLRKLEQACGSLSANAPQGYLAEQAARGVKAFTLLASGTGDRFFDDVSMARELATLRQRLERE